MLAEGTIAGEIKMRAFTIVVAMGVASNAFAGRAYEMFSARTEAEQLSIMAALVSSAGHTCASASRHIYMGDDPKSDSAFWTIRCSNGEDYIVQVKNSGQMETTILACTLANALGVKCWKPF